MRGAFRRPPPLRLSLSSTDLLVLVVTVSAGRFSTVIVFYVGGTTYEEAAKVAAINNGTLSIGGAGGWC